MRIEQLAAEVVFLSNQDLERLADYLVRVYPDTADQLEAEIAFKRQDLARARAERDAEIFSPYYGA